VGSSVQHTADAQIITASSANDPKQTSGKSIRENEIAALFRDRQLEPVHLPILDYRGNVETDEPFLGEQ
jgi:hypothetical protein